MRTERPNLTIPHAGSAEQWSSTWNVPIPIDPGLIGGQLVLQAFVPDALLAAPLPATMSNALVATIGI